MANRRVGQNKHQTEFQKEATLQSVASMLRMGLPGVVIAQQHGVSTGMVSKYKKEILERYVEDNKGKREDFIAEQKIRLSQVRLMAVEGWRKSMSPKAKKVKEWTPLQEEENKDGKKVRKNKKLKSAPMREVLALMKKVTQVEGRLPAAEFLNVILKTVEIECRIDGLFVEIKLEQNNVTINWDSMRSPTPIVDPMQEFEAKLLGHQPKTEFEAEPKESKNSAHRNGKA